MTENAYALIIKDDNNYILSEAYARNDAWNELLPVVMNSGKDELLLYLPSNHPLLNEASKHCALIDSSEDIWHGEVAMVNMIDENLAEQSGLTNMIAQKKLFFPLADKF